MVVGRTSLRLKRYDYSQGGWYFVTICTFNRVCIFGAVEERRVYLNEFGEAVKKVWMSIKKQYLDVDLDEYVIMPNHIHGIIVIRNQNKFVGAIHELPLQQNDIRSRRRMLLPKIVGYFKMKSSKEINVMRNKVAVPVWQRNYYEHIIRNEQDCSRIKHYIYNNPGNWAFDRENPEN